MATHRFVTAAERWKAIASGKLATGPHILDTGNIISGMKTFYLLDYLFCNFRGLFSQISYVGFF